MNRIISELTPLIRLTNALCGIIVLLELLFDDSLPFEMYLAGSIIFALNLAVAIWSIINDDDEQSSWGRRG